MHTDSTPQRTCSDCGAPISTQAFRCRSCAQLANFNCAIEEPNPSGLCMCGCGETTALASQTSVKHGYIRGKPMRYICGHHRRGYFKEGPLYRVDVDTGCWVWQRKITHGYAYHTVNGKTVRAARLFYECYVGPIDEGLTVDHLCRNRACVNPLHLEAVSITENIRRKPATKLTIEKAREIRALTETMTQAEIAKRFGVCNSLISRIVSGQIWKDVT